MSTPDIYLGPGDTFPITHLVLRGADNDDGSPGDPADLSDAVQVVFRYQLRAATYLPANRMMTVDAPAEDGAVSLDWLDTGGGIPSGDYNARVTVTYADGHTESFPQLRPGALPASEFYWLHVGRDFIGIPGIVSLNVLETDLASTALALGASMVGVHDASNLLTSTTVEDALEELAGGVAALAAAVDPDLAILATTTLGGGASRIGVQDAAGLITATTVEGALGELATGLLLRPLTTDLAATTAAKGAAMIGIQDAGNLITATTVEGALAEQAVKVAARPSGTDLASQAGGLGASLIGFNDSALYVPPIYGTTVQDALAYVAGTMVPARALSSDLASVAAAKGASLIGIQDAGNLITATTVEGALAELAATVPLTRGGTGQITAAAGYDALFVTAPALTSAATVNLALAGCPGTYAIVNGSTGPITSFGTAPAGTSRILRFAGTPTITHNATSLILPGAADIVAAVGDVMFLHSLGAGNWRVTSYLRAAVAPWNADASSFSQGTVALARGGTGQATAPAAFDALSIKAPDLTSAATVDLSLAGCAGVYAVVNGSTGPITSFGTAPAGVQRTLRFAGTPTITHNAASLILPGAADIVVAAGDVMYLHSLGAGSWRCTSYLRAAVAPWNGDASALTAGAVSIARGGTGQTSATAGLNALQVLGAGLLSLITLTDATNSGDAAAVKAPVLHELRHITSGTTTTGLGAGYAVNLQVNAGTERQVMTDVTAYTSSSNGAEVASRSISLMAAGALAVAVVFGTTTDYSGASFPNDGTATAPSVTVGLASDKLGFFRSGSGLLGFAASGTRVLRMSAAGLNMDGQVLGNSSTSPAAPAVTVGGSGASNNGMYGPTSTSLGFAAGGVNVLTLTKTTGAAVAFADAILAGNATTTADEVFSLKHTSAGNAGVGYGVLSAVDLQSSTGVSRRAMTDVTSWTAATNLSEESNRIVSLMAGGSLVKVGGWGLTNVGTYAMVYAGDLGNITGMRNQIGTNALELVTAGSAYMRLQSGVITVNNMTNFNDRIALAPPATTSGVLTKLSVTPAADTGTTASTEAIDVDFALGRTRTWATGNVTTQRAMLIRKPTYAFAGASTLSTAATLAIEGAPVAGANASITRSLGLWVQAGDTFLGGRLSMTTAQKIGFADTLTSADNNWTLGRESPITGGVVVTDGIVQVIYGGSAPYGYVIRSSTGVSLFEILGVDGSARHGGTLSLAPPAAASGTAQKLLLTPGTDIGTTASTEAVDVDFNLSRTRSWATGALTTQRAMVIRAPTYAFVGASVVTTAATLAISGAPIAGANATLTNNYSLWTQAGTVRHDLADAATATTPDAMVYGHTTSGVPAAGFGLTAAIELHSATNVLRRAMTDITKWTSPSNTAEAASRTIAMMNAGSLADILTIGPTGIAVPGGSIAAPGIMVGGTGWYHDTTNACMGLSYGGASAIIFNAATMWFQSNSAQITFGSDIGAYIKRIGATLSLDFITPGKFSFVPGIPGSNRTASTEYVGGDINLSRTVTFGTGALATQREFLVRAPTYAFVAASVITDAATVAISAAPIAGAFATITNAWSLWTQAGAVRFDLADAATATTPDAIVQRHTTSGTPAAGYGLLNAVELHSSTNVLRRASTDVTAWTTATNTAEMAKRTFSLMQSGTLVECGGYSIWAGPQPGIFIGPYSYQHGFRAASTGLLEMWVAGGIVMRNNSICMEANVRLNTAKGADVASATSITLGNAGNIFALTGVTTVASIVTTSWQAGSRVTLLVPVGITITHTAAATAGTIFLRAGADLVPSVFTGTYALDLVYNGTNWVQPGASIEVYKPLKGANLTDAAVLVNPGTDKASEYVLPAATLTVNRSVTLGVTGTPPTGMLVRVVRRDLTAFTMAVINGGTNGGTLFTFAASPTEIRGFTAMYNGVDWVAAGFEFLAAA